MEILKKFNWLFPVLILLTLLLGTIGFHQHGVLHGEPSDWISCFYYSIQLFIMESGGAAEPLPFLLQFSRFLAPALTAGGIFLALWEPFNQSFLLFKLRFWKDHIVVCGLSKKAELLIMNFLKNEERFKIVVIDLNEDHSSISHLRKNGVIVLNGNATDEEVLIRANIIRAKYLLALTNDEKTNIHIAQKASSIFNQFPDEIPEDNILQVNIHIDDFYTMNIFKEFHEKSTPDLETYQKGASKVDYHAFSIYQLAAMSMVDNFSPDKYVSLANDDDPPAHVLILGDNIAAQYLILEAAQMYHFANLKTTQITVVSDEPDRIAHWITSHYPFLAKCVDVRYIFVNDFFAEPCPIACDEISVCFVALDDDGKSVYFSRKLRQHLFSESERTKEQSLKSFGRYQNFRQSVPPIKVLLPRNTALVNIFEDVGKEMKALNIELLNMDDEVCNKKTIVDNRKEEDFIAKHIHYEWAKNQALKQNIPVGTMQAEWDKLRDAQKDSNRLPARHLYIKLRYVKADLSDQDSGEELDFDALETEIWDRIARMEHNRWMAEKYIGGFMPVDKTTDKHFGAFLKVNLKSHWDLVPFDQLDEATQEYDKFTFKMAPVIAHLNHKRILKRPG